MSDRRKICVLTGSRAEYGLLRWLMQDIREDVALELQLIATGMHLSPEFGATAHFIEADGFKIDERVEMLLSSDSGVGMAKSMGLGLIGFADAFQRLGPDLLVLLGDRFETFAAAQAAMSLRIPIAHIHGGEVTEGAIDEAMRHAISKMAHLHFATAQVHCDRLLQMGEEPSRVFNVGAPGLDYLQRLKLLGREELEALLEFSLDGGPILLATYHPVTLGSQSVEDSIEAFLEALLRVEQARIIITHANADAEGRRINELLEEGCRAHRERVLLRSSLGHVNYLSLMKLADVVVGNSSSGIIEAPAARTPTVNIGIRQAGRLRSESIIDCEEDAASISQAIEQALSASWRERTQAQPLVYGDGQASSQMAKILRECELKGLLIKQFQDLEGSGQT